MNLSMDALWGEVPYLVLVIFIFAFFRVLGTTFKPGKDFHNYSTSKRLMWSLGWSWMVWICATIGQQVPRNESLFWKSTWFVSLSAIVLIVLTAGFRWLASRVKEKMTKEMW